MNTQKQARIRTVYINSSICSVWRQKIHSRYDYIIIILEKNPTRSHMTSTALLSSHRGVQSFLSARFLENGLNPFRTAIPFWGQTTWNLSALSPTRDCRSIRVLNVERFFFEGSRPGLPENASLVRCLATLTLPFWKNRKIERRKTIAPPLQCVTSKSYLLLIPGMYSLLFTVLIGKICEIENETVFEIHLW